MRSRRAVFLLGIASAILVGAALRLGTYRQLRDGLRTRAVSSDDYYHLRRARFAVAHFPRTILFDPLMNFPRGGVAIWPPLFDLALAAPPLLLHGSRAPVEAIEREAAWMPIVFAAGSIALAGLLARRVYGGRAGIVAAFFVAVAPAHILWSQYGHVEQHCAESFFGLAALVAYLGSREHPSGGTNARREALAGVALAFAVLAWQGAIFWGAIFALSLFLESLIARRSVFRAAVLTLLLPAALVAAATAAWTRGIDMPFTYVSFGYFQPMFLLAVAAGTALLDTAIGLARRSLPRRSLILRAAFGAALLALLIPFAGEILASFAGGVGYVAGRTQEVSGEAGYVSYPGAWLKGIFEARPLFADGIGPPVRQLSLALFFVPCAISVWARRALARRRPGVHVALVVWAVVTVFLAVSQRVNVYYAVPLCALALVEAARFLAAKIRRRTRQRARPSRALAALAGIALALPMAAGIREELASERVPGSDLFATLGWMRRSLPHTIDPYDSRLLRPPPPPELARAESVLAPWSLGHLLLYEAELPVVANNFGYGFLDSLRFFLAQSEEEALDVARRHRVRWVVATDLVSRMNDYAGYLGKAPPLAVSGAGWTPTSAYFRTMQSRLYDFDGREVVLPDGAVVPPLASFRLAFTSRTGIQRGGRFVARWKVFEIQESPGGPGTARQGRVP
jgi:dolichyl-diphosphooligosaccharide--protein glycosyltransferase